MASAFWHLQLSPPAQTATVRGVSASRCAGLLLLAACAAAPSEHAAVAGPAPTVAVAVALPRGAVLRVMLAPGTADELVPRAALVWWREALAQSPWFDVLESDASTAPSAEILLSLDSEGCILAATCRRPGHEPLLLAGENYRGRELTDGLDRLAWAARLALGEAAPAPVPLALCTTPDGRALLAVEDAQALVRSGGFASARRALQDARSRDGGSPYILEGLAAMQLLAGEAAAAERLCREALGYRNRLQPRTEHRLARTMLLARASLQPEASGQYDAELLALAMAIRRERPFDPQGPWTAAVAHNYRGEFAEAVALLRPLRQRHPEHPLLAYHCGWACLGSGAASEACQHFDAAALRLPLAWVLVPQSLARHASGAHELLAQHLRDLVAEQADSPAPLVHHLRRMQAAHALLRGDTAVAARAMLDDLQWLATHALLAGTRLGELAEQGEVLVRLGKAAELQPILAVLQAQHQGTGVAEICAYIGGLSQVALRQRRLSQLEEQLDRGSEHAFGLRLAAFAHELAGEIGDRHTALARAARLSDSPLTKALLAQSLRQIGETAAATQLRDTLRRELLTLNLRGRQQHPLLGPELAYAFLLE